MRFHPIALAIVLLIGTTGAFTPTRYALTKPAVGLHQTKLQQLRVLQLSLQPASSLQVNTTETAAPFNNNHFQRDEQWLENATNDVLDTNIMPYGSLNTDDVEQIIGLMTAWARRQSVESALLVERLLKRVIDDMKAGNRAIHLTTRLYTVVIDAWARSGVEGSANRAQSIHDGIVAMYKETSDPNIAPTLTSYNTVMYAWSKCPGDDAPRKGEELLLQMVKAYRNGNLELKPDAVTFSALIEIYGRRPHPEHVERAEQIFLKMDKLQVKKSPYACATMQNVYVKSLRMDAPNKAESILLEMIENDDPSLHPAIINYNAVLNALSRTPSIENTKKADRFLDRMMMPATEGGYNIEPDRMSYIYTIHAGSRCPDGNVGAKVVGKALQKMEDRALFEWNRKQENSSVAPVSVYMDTESYNAALQTISKSDQSSLVLKIIAIISRMEELAELGHDVQPNRRTWNCLLHAFSRLSDSQSAPKAESILNRMWELHFAGAPHTKPDTFSYSSVLQTYQKSVFATAAERADNILRQYEEYYAAGHMDSPPEVVHYTMVSATWAKSRKEGAADRCAQIVAHMLKRHNDGFPNVKPNVRTYNALLDAVSRSRDVERAEQILYYMINLCRSGDPDVAPDSFSFNSVIVAICRSKKNGAGIRAEAILDRMIEYHEEGHEINPEARSFTHIIAFYGRSGALDGPYRAEYVLRRMIDLYQTGKYPRLEPNNFAFVNTIEAYAYKRHCDAGEVAERLLKVARELVNKYECTKLEINTELLNSVLFAWSSSGDKEAGRKAEIHLETMERQYETGNKKMTPDSRSFGFVLNAWSRSNTPGKARRALNVLRRMQEQWKNGNTSVEPSQHAYALVINSAGFANGSLEEEADAFEIAVSIFDEMVASGGELAPQSLTYGWFIQVCGRLTVPLSQKEEQIERAFQRCIEAGLVSQFVLARFRGAASERLYTRMLKPVLENLPDQISKQLLPPVEISQIPTEWKANISVTRRELSKPSRIE